MSLLHDSIGLPRMVSRSSARRFNLGEVAAKLDGLMTPARALNRLLNQRAELRAARRALELSLKPKVRIHLSCKTPDGRACVDLIV